MCLWLSWKEQQFPKLEVASSTLAKHTNGEMAELVKAELC